VDLLERLWASLKGWHGGVHMLHRLNWILNNRCAIEQGESLLQDATCSLSVRVTYATTDHGYAVWPDNTGTTPAGSDSETTETPPPEVWLSISVPNGLVRDRGRHISCGEPAIVRWISSESDRALIFFIAVARWVSTVLWLIPRT